MSQETIYQNGTAEVNVPATESIAISNYSGGIAKIYYHIITANTPPAWQFQQTLENSAVILGPFAVATIVKIDANNSKVFYNIGANPTISSGNSSTLDGYGADDFLKTTDESKYLRTDQNSTIAKSSGILRAQVGTGTAIDDVFTSSQSALEIYQATSGKDAYAYFEVKDDVYGYFGLSGADNDFVVGGGSFGAVRYRLWNRGSAPEASQVEAEAGTVTAARMFTPERIKQAINALALTANAISGSFTTVDGKTVTVVNGQITAIV